MENARRDDFSHIDYRGFSREIDALRRAAFESLSREDFLHLRKMERVGRLSTWIGYATAWILPNPLSAAAIALGVSTRWLLMHHISHGGYDRVPGTPERYKSRHFARGWRRFVDWFDWILPEAWACEHNILHHYNTGEELDPDLVERIARPLRELKCPRAIKYLLAFLIGMTWKAIYYAPNTLHGLDAYRKRRESAMHLQELRPGMFFDFRDRLVWKLWLSCYLPYVLFHFVLIPALFLPLGNTAVLFVLVNRLLAELIANFHSYMIIAPNHSGDDLYRFDEHYRNKPEFYVNQVLGSVNYRTGSDWIDFPQMWLNYQIEHHLVPNLPMTKYREIQPRVRALCEQYGLPYLQESIFRRFGKFLEICVGEGTMMWAEPPVERAVVAADPK